MPAAGRETSAHNLRAFEPLTRLILISSPEFGAAHQFAQSGKFEKTLPQTNMRVRTEDASAKSLASLWGQYTNTI